jgi:cyclopropane fatty-acyl-phospholipid synthase-like methyltransferase
MMALARRLAASARSRGQSLLRRWRNPLPDMVGRADEFELKRAFQIRFLLEHGLKPGVNLVDIGCGVLRGGLPIIRELDPDRYCGIDVRAECIRMAKREVRRAKLMHKKPTLLHSADLRSIRLERRFDVAWAFSVVFHLTDDALTDVFAFVSAHLNENGEFFANANLGVKPDGSWREFPVRWRTLDEYRTAAQSFGFSVESLGTLESLGHRSVKEPGENIQEMLVFRRFATDARGSRGGKGPAAQRVGNP